ncbi:TBC1 domain family member 2A isoform X2 [Pristis pectinata]|nr:TBC1 domain family member 2A isoform X2 [Pristis pectinata]XP_051875256.1 TBC1 domain family member 2A isoform X2 [Pristis pectinata]XP_051875257.1 TBC1 domain family member 2A isoform X2 [Pristis pectinata]XP_051875258.1 TBC1 domain family member 2A isoform X2 [Pristis pectinata]XP_051875259.1 TBC1 domain family member 2A isoform X2 [Pristis pectinata]
MMADELQVGKANNLEVFSLPENSAVQKECDDVDEEPSETEDLSDYLKSLSEGQAQSKKLCGYLNKLGGKGPLKGCKTRWFVYDPRKCLLYYFRTAHDSSPLGSMDLSHAAFNYCLEAEEGTFEIKTPEKDYTLKAKNREVMMYWLQQLQQKRWEHDDKQNHLFEGDVPTSEQSPDSPPPFKIEEETNEFLDPVKTPTGLVGEEAASLPAPLQPTTLYNISLKHLGTEIQNFGSKTVFQFYGNKQLRENRTSYEEINQATSEMSESPSLPKGADISVKECHLEVQKPPSQKSSTGNLKNMAGLLNASPVSQERLPVKDGIFQDKDTRLHNDILKLTRELDAQRDLVKLLHRALEAAQQEKRACSSYLAADDSTRLELVRHKVRQIRELENRVRLLEQEKQEMEQNLKLQQSHIEELKQHAQLLMEKNHAKQEVILKLSEQMAAENTDKPEDYDEVITTTLHELREKVSHMKDVEEGYKTQNKFLNSEIYQITKLWQKTRDREKALTMKCAYLEARYCQIESKYLVLLHKLQDISGQDETCQELVKQFISDQLKWEMKDESSLTVGRLCSEHDEYGFKLVSSPVQDQNILTRIQALERKSNNLMVSQEGQEKNILVKWENLLSSKTFGELVPTPELKNLIRNGIPKEHRRHVWRWCTNRRVQQIRERYSSNRYQELLKLCKNKQQAASKQIELDLPRTLTNNMHFSSPTSKMVQMLRRVLLAYSWQNPDIGYCQGLNRLAAIALLVLQEEEDAFWCLVAVVDCIMPEDYYSKTLTGSQVDQRVFKDLLSEKLPRLVSHFEQYNVDLSYITFNWFLVVFVDSLQTDILLRVWDAFLYEGTKVIFRYALAIFKYHEEEILKLHDNLRIYDYLQCLTKSISEGRKLMNIAFVEMNPFPMRLLRNRRTVHLEKLKAELRELERIRVEYVKDREEHKELIGVVSEDEEEM